MLSYKKFREDAINGKASTVDLVNKVIQNIENNLDLNAFISLNFEEARILAVKSDENFKNGNQRIAEGLIVAVKDNINVKNLKMTCASKMLENYISIYDATAVKKLKDAGAIIIGKANLDEFAMGSSNETSYFGNVLNPINKEYVPGGSSGGSAAAVAAGLCHIALGSETGGSVRQPASFTGTYGIKPTYGRVSRFGLTAFGSSLDQIGIFSSNLEDLALGLDIISGEDENDSTCVQEESTKSLININLSNKKNFKIGVIDEEMLQHSDDDVKEKYNAALKELEKQGHQLIPVSFAYSKIWIPTYYIIATAEASSNLSRFDGVRYGYRADNSSDMVKETRSKGFGAEVKRRIMLGTYVLSEGHHDAFYLNALKARRIIYNNYKSIFEKVDCVLTPTTPTPAFKFNSKINNPVAMYMSDFYVASANLAGIPAISIPVGTNAEGLPIGLQISTNNFDEEKLIQFANEMHFQQKAYTPLLF